VTGRLLRFWLRSAPLEVVVADEAVQAGHLVAVAEELAIQRSPASTRLSRAVLVGEVGRSQT
jgi:hypothetical protein